MRTLERTAAHLFISLIGSAFAICAPSSVGAQVADAPTIGPVRPAVVLRPHEPIKVRHGFEHLAGRFAGWNGDSLVLLFDIGNQLVLPIEDVSEIAARRRSADRAIAAGLFFGAMTWVTLKVGGVLGGGITQCDECVDSLNVWKTTGRVALVTASLVLIVDYFRPPYRIVYRRRADCC